MPKKRKSTPKSRAPRARRPRTTTSPAQNPLVWLGAGIAAWFVWGLTAPSTAGASTLPGGSTSPLPPGSSTPGGSSSSAAGDPHPEWPLLKSGSANPQTMIWQAVLVKGGFLPNVPDSTDGKFGPLTAAATKLLQEKARVEMDSIVGPETRKAASRLGLW